MRVKVFQWLGREFVALSGEGSAGLDPARQTRDLLLRFERELRALDLSLDNTVRTRLWGRDSACRDVGSRERVSVLSGQARSASSSYIAPPHFDSEAGVALDLLAMRPARPGREKTVKEYEPPIVPPRYVVSDSVLFHSGVTAVLPSLAEQVPDILDRIEASLADAGTSWEKAARVSCYLHRSQRLRELEDLFRQRVGVEVPYMDYAFVDGYSAEGKLVEIEVTAKL